MMQQTALHSRPGLSVSSTQAEELSQKIELLIADTGLTARDYSENGQRCMAYAEPHGPQSEPHNELLMIDGLEQGRLNVVVRGMQSSHNEWIRSVVEIAFKQTNLNHLEAFNIANSDADTFVYTVWRGS